MLVLLTHLIFAVGGGRRRRQKAETIGIPLE